MGPSDIPWASLALSHLRASQWPLSLSLKCISLDYLLVLILQLFLACCLTREAFTYLISKITTLLPLPSSLYYLSSSFIVHNTELHQTGSSPALFHWGTPALRDYALYITGFQYIISQWMNEWIPITYTSFISTGNSVINKIVIALSSVQFSSVTQSCPTLCNPMNRSTPSLPVHHQLPESTQTHVHRVGDAIQTSHPLLSPSPPAPNPSQHQGLFQWVSSSHEVAKVLEFQLQHQSFQWTPRTGLL